MDKEKTINGLKDLLNGSPWNLRDRLLLFIKDLESGESKARTYSQNRALHLGFTLTAEALNNAGKDMRQVLKPEVEIPWTTQSVKDHLFRPLMVKMYSKKSTTELTKHEIDPIWETLFRFLGQNHGIEYIDFPSDDDPAPLK